MSVRTASTGLILATLLALTGCAAPEAPAVETPESTPAVSATPSPEPEVLADFGFTFFRAGQLSAADFVELGTQLGSPVAGFVECPWYAEVETHGTDAGTFAFTDPDGIDPGIEFFYTQYGSGAEADLPRNAEGVGVGSTREEVLAAYPDAVVDAYVDMSVGTMTRITVDDPASESFYVFAITEGSPVVDLLQWGFTAGGQWAHLCLPL